MADKAYDSDAVRLLLASMGITATVPPESNRRHPAGYGAQSCKARHLVENAFGDAKQFRGIATRYAKLGKMYEGMWSLVAWFTSTRGARRGPSKYRRQAEVDGQDGAQLQMEALA